LVIEHWTFLSYILNAVCYTLFSNVSPIEEVNMKLAGLVFLGLVTSVVIWLLSEMLFSLIPKAFGFGYFVRDTMTMIEILGLVPFSFFLGSIVTGYFSYYDIEDKEHLCFIVPALYFILLFGCVLLISRGSQAAIHNGFLLVAFLYGLVWYLSSLAGVFFGYELREYLVERRE
jgi:hypothetical protein